MQARLPSVAVVIPTRDRAELAQAAVNSALAQDYAGVVGVFVVHDRSKVDHSLTHDSDRRQVRVLTNNRTAGLAGTRNTGVLASAHDLVAFLDDDDCWLPTKLSAQVALLQSQPDTEFCSSGVLVAFEGRTTPRLAGTDSVTHRQLLRSRLSMLHSSTFLVRRGALIDGIGLVDEEVPGGQNEDWDLLLRAARRGPIAVVDEPLVRVHWGRSSFYARRWDTKIASLEWMLDHHPELSTEPVGLARVYGQLAFAQACSHRRAAALTWIVRALRHNPREWRAGAAALVAVGLVDGERVLEALHRFGRGV